MGLFETGNALAVLSASRNINWQAQPVTAVLAGVSAGLPNSAASGIDLSDVVKALVSVYAREEVHHRSGRYTIPTHDAATSYAAVIGGTTVSYVNGADTRADQGLRGLQLAMAASGPIIALVTVTVVNAAGDDVTGTAYDNTTADTILATSAVAVLFRGLDDTTYTIDFLAVGGVGVMVCIADPLTLSLRIYATRKLTAGVSQWLLINGAQETIDHLNWTERLTVNGYRRLYVEIYNVTAAGDGATVTYQPGVFIGPAILE